MIEMPIYEYSSEFKFTLLLINLLNFMKKIGKQIKLKTKRNYQYIKVRHSIIDQRGEKEV